MDYDVREVEEGICGGSNNRYFSTVEQARFIDGDTGETLHHRCYSFGLFIYCHDLEGYPPQCTLISEALGWHQHIQDLVT